MIGRVGTVEMTGVAISNQLIFIFNLCIFGAISGASMFSRQYMLIMFIGLLPYAFAQCYASTLRETGETKVPMLCGMAAVLVNLFLNYVLIFGKFGAPALGVQGAAIATVVSRFVDVAGCARVIEQWIQTGFLSR